MTMVNDDLAEAVTVGKDPDHDEILALPRGVFYQRRLAVYKWRYTVSLEVRQLLGGVPSDPRVHAAWLRKKLDGTTDEYRREIMQKNVYGLLGLADLADDPTAMTPEAIEAIESLMGGEAGTLKNAAAEEMVKSSVERFYRAADGTPCIRAAQVKAAFKEAGNICWGSQKRKWGPSGKGTKSFLAEHVNIEPPVGHDLIPVVGTPVRLLQRITHINGPAGPRSAFSVHECVDVGRLSCIVYSDHEFSEEDWGTLWVTAEEQGLGATRSQGYGRYRVTDWSLTPNATYSQQAS